jgi:IS1 family transposase
MRTDLTRGAGVLRMLLEGMSIRAAERITGMKRQRICDLILLAGTNCSRLLQNMVVGVQSNFVELDEIWDFVGMKGKKAERKGMGPEFGDSWTWLAIDAESKLILAHAVGWRDEETCQRFLGQVSKATTGRVQITSDGLGLYTYNVPLAVGSRVDFAQLVKSYSNAQDEVRYSPGTIVKAEKVARFGNPDLDHVSTSYSERLNLSVRMHSRRFTRLTNAHSKSWAHHEAMMSLFVAWYNLCRRHQTLKGQTPAMASGLTDHVWTIEELLKNAANC